MHLDASLPGGNILLERTEGDHVYLRQDLRDTEVWWFWWCFRVLGAAGRTLTFHFTDGDVLGVRGPACSLDRGNTWAWLGADCMQDSSFTYAFPSDTHEVRFAFAFPYVHTDLRRFLTRLARSPYWQLATLCRTRGGRDAELLRLGRLDRDAPHRVLITCRHHACESMASHVLEGLMEAVLGDGDEGSWLRQNVELLVVPFVDKDGVEAGDQGKCRRPRDHNRDYVDVSIHETVAAIRALVPPWSEGRLHLALDLHCPWIRGEYNEWVYCVEHENRAQAAELRRFSEVLERVACGPIPYLAANNLPFGQGWNTGIEQGKSAATWASELPDAPLATTMEIPYANASGVEVNADTARSLGRDLARAIRNFL